MWFIQNPFTFHSSSTHLQSHLSLLRPRPQSLSPRSILQAAKKLLITLHFKLRRTSSSGRLYLALCSKLVVAHNHRGRRSNNHNKNTQVDFLCLLLLPVPRWWPDVIHFDVVREPNYDFQLYTEYCVACCARHEESSLWVETVENCQWYASKIVPHSILCS